MGIQGMKVQHHHLTHGFWPDHQPPPTSLTLGCKRLRPLAPKLTTTTAAATSFDLKSFIRQPQTSPRQQHGSSDTTQQAEVVQQQPPGGTRWNPTQEQIGILEMLYKGGMRTPNAQQIEHITAHLAKYGKIEGKNVFYWFQNHKARERQKQKRYNNNLGRGHSSSCAPSPLTTTACDLALSNSTKGDLGDEEDKNGAQMGKRKCRSWELEENCTEGGEELGEDRTLKLFPLHPEGRS